MNILSQQFVFDALDAEKAGVNFPVDFDDVWAALGYSGKNEVKRRLVTDFILGLDYCISNNRIAGKKPTKILISPPIKPLLSLLQPLNKLAIVLL
jgi:hypothetical protein